MEKYINKQIVEAKKEIDRLIDRRSENLGNSINFIFNEITIEQLRAKIEAYQQILDYIDLEPLSQDMLNG